MIDTEHISRPGGWTIRVLAVWLVMFGVRGMPEARGLQAVPSAESAADTVTVRGRLVVVGNEPFTRQRIVQKGGGGYLLHFEDADRIELRRTSPTEVRVVGIPYRDDWQGTETPHLRVVKWSYVEE